MACFTQDSGAECICDDVITDVCDALICVYEPQSSCIPGSLYLSLFSLMYMVLQVVEL